MKSSARIKQATAHPASARSRHPTSPCMTARCSAPRSRVDKYWRLEKSNCWRRPNRPRSSRSGTISMPSPPSCSSRSRPLPGLPSTPLGFGGYDPTWSGGTPGLEPATPLRLYLRQRHPHLRPTFAEVAPTSGRALRSQARHRLTTEKCQKQDFMHRCNETSFNRRRASARLTAPAQVPAPRLVTVICL